MEQVQALVQAKVVAVPGVLGVELEPGNEWGLIACSRPVSLRETPVAGDVPDSWYL